MAVTLSLTFDDTWAARMLPMINRDLGWAKDNPVLTSFLESRNLTVEQLTPKQKAKLWFMYVALEKLAIYEGHVAASAAEGSAITDVETNFPLDVGEA